MRRFDSDSFSGLRSLTSDNENKTKRMIFLMPLWGESYFLKFLNYGLLSILGQENLDNLSRKYEFHLVFLSKSSDEIFFYKHLYKHHRIFYKLNQYFIIKFIYIDDILNYFDNSYGMVINVSYFRGMNYYKELDGCNYFIILVADYILSEKVLTSLIKKIECGANVVYSISLRCIDSDIISFIDKYKYINYDDELKISEREAVAIGLVSLHPSFKAKIHSDFPIHSDSIQHIYWRTDADTLIGKCFMLHPLVIRPTKWVEYIPGQVDYAFVSALAPEGPFETIGDSDEGVFLELQFNPDHEKYLSDFGQRTIEKDSLKFSKWATNHFLSLSRFNFIIHSEEISENTQKYLMSAEKYINNITKNREIKLQDPYSHSDWIHGFERGVLNIPPEVSKEIVYSLMFEKYLYYKNRFKIIKMLFDFIDGSQKIKKNLSELLFYGNNLIFIKEEKNFSKYVNEKFYKNICTFFDIDLLMGNNKDISLFLGSHINKSYDNIFLILPMRYGFLLDKVVILLKEILGERSFSIILFREPNESFDENHAWAFSHFNFKINNFELFGNKLISLKVYQIRNDLRNLYFELKNKYNVVSIFKIIKIIIRIVFLLTNKIFTRFPLNIQNANIVILNANYNLPLKLESILRGRGNKL